MKKIADWPIARKILSIPILTTVLFTLFVVFYLFPTIEHTLYTQKRVKVEQLVDVAYGAMALQYDKWQSGELTELQAKENAKEVIRSMRYDGGNYIWIHDTHSVMLAHSANPELEGQNLSSLVDVNGVYIVKGLAEVSLSDGRGYVDYSWPKAGSDIPVMKISYTKYFAEWKWCVGTGIYVDDVKTEVQSLQNKSIIFCILLVVLILLASYIVSNMVSKPLAMLKNVAKTIADGDLDAELPAALSKARKDEIGQLISNVDSMRLHLKDYIENLATTTAEKEKITSELSIAEDIQHGILPKLFPPFPERYGLDVFASLNSAKEVGGDLYDFMLLDEDTLYICIGDVSGKGVPASLFMAVGKTLLKSTIQTMKDPAKTLTHVNDELADGNDTCLFITTFCGILDLKTNILTYSSAGHNPPVLVDSKGVRYMEVPINVPLAAMEGILFENSTVQLEFDSKFLLYTDGVTEAMDIDGKQYGEDRLLETLAGIQGRTAEKYINVVNKDVKAFVKDAPPSDDITMLCISNNKVTDKKKSDLSPTTYLVLTNHQAEFKKLVTWLEEMSVKLAWPKNLHMQLNLVLEEWLVNVVSYAFENGDDTVHEIELRLWQGEDEIKLEIIDDGIAFDPVKKADPDTTLPIEEREIGGLGIMFIKSSVDEFTYARENDLNIVTMIKKL